MQFARSGRVDGTLLASVLSASVLVSATGAQAAPPPPPPVVQQQPQQPRTVAPPSQVQHMPAQSLQAPAQPLQAPAQPLQGPADGQALPVGSTLSTQLTSGDVNTKTAKAGDAVTMQVVAPYPNANAAFAGATVRGHVASVRPAGQGRKALLSLAFDSITFANGRNEPISGSVLAMEAKGENSTARKTLGAAAGAAVGSQTIGRIIGGSAGSVVGLLGGAVAGLAYASNDKPNVSLATGSHVKIQTTSTVEVPLRQAGQ